MFKECNTMMTCVVIASIPNPHNKQVTTKMRAKTTLDSSIIQNFMKAQLRLLTKLPPNIWCEMKDKLPISWVPSIHIILAYSTFGSNKGNQLIVAKLGLVTTALFLFFSGSCGGGVCGGGLEHRPLFPCFPFYSIFFFSQMKFLLLKREQKRKKGEKTES